MLLRDYVVQSATQAGIPSDDPALKEFTDNKDVLEVSDELTKKITGSFLTVDAAKNNSDLIAFFKAQNLNGVDKRMAELYTELKLSPEDVGKLKMQENTFDKVNDLITLLNANAQKELTDYKASNAKPEHKEELQERDNTIADLNEKIRLATEGGTEEVDTLKQAHQKALLSVKVNTMLAGYNYANKDVDVEGNIAMVTALLNKGLATDGLRIGEREGVPTLEKVDGSHYFVDNAKVSLKDYTDGILSNNKLLAASPAPPAPGTPPDLGTPTIPLVGVTEAEQALTDYTAQQTQ